MDVVGHQRIEGNEGKYHRSKGQWLENTDYRLPIDFDGGVSVCIPKTLWAPEISC